MLSLRPSIRLLGLALSTTLIIGTSSASNVNAAETEEASENAETQRLVITGSRIKRGNLGTPVPITLIDSTAISASGVTNLADLLRQTPSVGISGFSSQNSNFSVQNSGINTVNLRNLGEARTLVLVNGRRYVSGVPGSSSVDMNTIPTDLIERVEIITGGASAVYGSDAVAGVVNIVTKKDFDGVAIDFQTGFSEEGGGDKHKFTLTAGSEFAEGKGSSVFHFAFNEETGLKSSERGITDNYYDTGGTGTYYESNPSSYSPQGRFDVAGGTNWHVNDDGSVVPVNWPEHGFDRSDYRTISVPQKRLLFSAGLNYQINNNLNFFNETMFAQTKTDAELEPMYFWDTLVFSGDDWGLDVNNPFIPTPIYNDMIAQGADTLGFRRRFAENAGRSAENTRQTFRFAFGLEGDIGDWEWDAYYAYGSSTQRQTFYGEMNILNARAALTAEADPSNPGGYRCVDSAARVAGCVPMNIFGAGSISADALAYVRADTNLSATVAQQTFSVNLSNSELFTMPAGNVGMAMGFETRKESSESLNDPLVVQGLTGGNKIANTVGEFDVDEFYVEALIPLLSEVAGVQSLDAEFAYRAADYSTVGGVDSWKVGLNWSINDDFRLRTSVAQSTRAPNINELFAGAGQTFPGIQDPCDGVTNTSALPGQTACLLDPAVQSWVDANGVLNYTSFDTFNVSGYDLGNPDAEEETGKTFTAGFVYTPIDEFNFSIDYWKVKVNNALQVTGRQIILDSCYSSTTLDNRYCNQITRFTRTGQIQFINDGPANQGYQLKSGIDIKAHYSLDLDSSKLNFDLYWVRMLESDLQTAEGALTGEVLDQLGDLSSSGDFQDNATFNISYAYGPFDLNLETKYLSSIYDSLTVHNARVANAQPDYELNNIDSTVLFNFQARYKLGLNEQYEVYLGIENLLDEEPPFLPTGTASTVWGNDTASVWSPVGRYFYFGAKAHF